MIKEPRMGDVYKSDTHVFMILRMGSKIAWTTLYDDEDGRKTLYTGNYSSQSDEWEAWVEESEYLGNIKDLLQEFGKLIGETL